MQRSNLESLIEKATEHEKKYDWLQAAEEYKKAIDLVLNEKDVTKVANLQEKIGFCFYRASLQGQSNAQFRKILKKSIIAYEKESELLKAVETEEAQVNRIHADALTCYVKSWYETDPKVIKKLLDEWWTLENQILKVYERSGDLLSVGRICNELLEYSIFDRFWLVSDSLEQEKMYKESIILAKKTIEIFSRLDDDYELSRAYLSLCWYQGWSDWFEENQETLLQIGLESQKYSNKALELSKKVGDDWLISRSYQSAWSVVYMLHWDPSAAIETGENMFKHGKITKDNYLIGFGLTLNGTSLSVLSANIDDPEKQKESYEKSLEIVQQATHNFNTINNIGGLWLNFTFILNSLSELALIETDTKKRQRLLEKAIKVCHEGIKRFKGWKLCSGDLEGYLARILFSLATTKTTIEEKKDLLLQAQFFEMNYLKYMQEVRPFSSFVANNYYRISLIQNQLSIIEQNKKEKLSLLKKALSASKKATELLKKKEKFYLQKKGIVERFGRYYNKLASLFEQIYFLTDEKKNLYEGIEVYKQALTYYQKAEMHTHVAELYWTLAQLYDQVGEFQDSSGYYESASKAYDVASKKIPQLKDFYHDYSLYMRAWSQIERGRYSHSIEDYEEARLNYEQAAKLHETTNSWSYLNSNYFAWSYMEEAEGLSRKEKTLQAKQKFEKALEEFCKAKESFKHKLEETTSPDEKEMTQKMFEASDLREHYCQARILLEKAKLLDGEGKHLQSSKTYGEVSKKISAIVDRVDVEAERKELEYVAILCQAWEKMANAEEATSSESYLEAAALFEEAKDYCYTSKAGLWALGNSNFCRGLAAGVNYQTNLDLGEHAKAKSFMKNASTHYEKAGFKAASEYARATLRLFDAYLFMNQAEVEADQEKRARQYQMAENLLQIAASSFMKAKQPEKQAQVQSVLANVREEKALAVSLSQVMQAPSIASTTSSFAAPTPTSEASVGLEKFEHANVQANLVTTLKQVKVGESFCLSVEFVNAGRESALLMKVDDFVPRDFVVVKKPEIYRIEDTCLNMKGKQLAPLKLVEVKLTLQPSKKGEYQLNPMVHYLDERGQSKSLELKTVEIKVEEVRLENRVSSGTLELDSLLLGGIPKEYAVVLSGPPCDEQELLIKNFLKAGSKESITFYISTEATGLESLLQKPNFFLFLCNPKPKIEVPDLPNVYRLQSKADITNLGITLTKAIRNIDQSIANKRVCVEILSDVLMAHGPKNTREWISGLITNLGAKGFTMLAVINPLMHTSEELHSVLDLFDGEISITQSDNPLDCKKSILVKKLRNQDYIKNPICLTQSI